MGEELSNIQIICNQMCKQYKRAQVMINACDDYKAVSLMHFVCGFAA